MLSGVKLQFKNQCQQIPGQAGSSSGATRACISFWVGQSTPQSSGQLCVASVERDQIGAGWVGSSWPCVELVLADRWEVKGRLGREGERALSDN